MNDDVLQILEKIQNQFNEEVKNNTIINNILIKQNKGTANYADSLSFAKEIGKCVCNAFKNNVSDDVLPDGKMYYDIAKTLIEPICKENYKRIASHCVAVQTSLNRKANIGLNAIEPTYKSDRTEGLIKYISSVDKYSSREKSFLQSLITNAKFVVDDSVKENADFHFHVGLSPKIVRTTNGKCCKWCQNIAGVYDYKDVKKTGNDVFRRHANCDCTVTYDPGDGSKKLQDVWSKKWNDISKSDKIDLTKRLHKEDIIRDYLNLHSKAIISISPKKIKTNNLLFDDIHINTERDRGISREEAISWINNSIFSVNVWNGKFERFFSKEGAVYVDLENQLIRTAFSYAEYTNNLIKLMEALK